MELLEALKTRRSVRRFTSEPIPQKTLEDIMALAPWVPNHHVTEPWRFVVATGDSLKELAGLRAAAVKAKRAGEPNANERADKARQEFLQSAAVVAVIQKLDPNPVRRDEDHAAMALATYNLMLAAWDRGVGSYWNTGPLIGDPAVARWLDLGDDERTVAFVRMGYPDIVPVTRRTPIEDKTEWRS